MKMPKLKNVETSIKQVAGVMDLEHAHVLRRISLTLRRWYELECNGEIQRDGEKGDGTPFRWSTVTYKPLCRIPDREAGAIKRLKSIFQNYPNLSYYLQTDPRGCALYILRPGDVPEGKDPAAYYSRGIPVY
jgi:hypothetical protein